MHRVAFEPVNPKYLCPRFKLCRLLDDLRCQKALCDLHGSNYNRLKPIHDELKTLKNGWGKKREKFEQAHESDLIIWNAANRFLHANLPEGTKSFKVSEWQKEFDELKAQSTGEYEELKTKRSEVKELQQIRKCIDIVEQAEQRTQEQTHQTPRRKKEDISL